MVLNSETAPLKASVKKMGFHKTSQLSEHLNKMVLLREGTELSLKLLGLCCVHQASNHHSGKKQLTLPVLPKTDH